MQRSFNRITTHPLINTRRMKTFLISCIALFTAADSLSQNNPTSAYSLIATVIEAQVDSFSVPFAIGRTEKVSHINIMKEGNVIFFYNEDRKPETFNLFELYKTPDAPLGIQLYETSSFVQFHLSEERTRVIQFGKHEKAKEVYDNLLVLLQAGKDQYRPIITLDFKQTLDSINHALKTWTEYKPELQVMPNGEAKLLHDKGTHFNFHFKKLKSSKYAIGFEVNGIEMELYKPGAKAIHNWIRFNEDLDNKAFIKFGDIPESALQAIHRLIVHLDWLIDSQ